MAAQLTMPGARSDVRVRVFNDSEGAVTRRRDLGLPPSVALGLVVKHPTADLDAGGADPNVAPVADGGRTGTEARGDFFGG